MQRHIGWITPIAVIVAVLIGSMQPVRAGQNNDRRLTRREVNKYWERVSKKRDWNEQQFARVLRMCQYNKRLVDRFLGLTKKGFSPQTVRASFAVTEGSKKLLDEFWKYVNKRKIPPAEVRMIFQNLPDNQVIRWKYVSWRRGGSIHKQDMREKLARKQKGRLPRSFPRKECLMVFRMTRFDVKLIDEYFTKRLKGKPAMEALKPIRKKVLKEIRKEKEEEKKEAKKKRKNWKKKWNKYKDVLAASKGKKKQSKKNGGKKGKGEQKEQKQEKKEEKSEYVAPSDKGVNQFLVDDKKDKKKKQKDK